MSDKITCCNVFVVPLTSPCRGREPRTRTRYPLFALPSSLLPLAYPKRQQKRLTRPETAVAEYQIILVSGNDGLAFWSGENPRPNQEVRGVVVSSSRSTDRHDRERGEGERDGRMDDGRGTDGQETGEHDTSTAANPSSCFCPLSKDFRRNPASD